MFQTTHMKAYGLPVLPKGGYLRQKVKQGKKQVVRAQFQSFDELFNQQFQKMQQIQDRMDQQFQQQFNENYQLNQFSSSFDDVFNRQLESMRSIEQQMDQYQNKIEQDFQEMQQQMKLLETNERQFTTEGSNFQYKYESRESPGMYKRYESFQIVSGSAPYQQQIISQQQQQSSVFSPLLVVALVLAGGYAAVTAWFAATFDNTQFKEEKKWMLLLLWPVLVIFSESFRAQMKKALLNRGSESKQ
eukprot:TRINITY_DN8281_c1_g2_i1.p2 TRINITY_DN8281_c1_g2~~TRINITY_DN8281_c1_g2_i1.p2  ORF type:complete len:245 (-),score=38.59 TRINITY_DN8281_c1_g2_i1:671-1405(-)